VAKDAGLWTQAFLSLKKERKSTGLPKKEKAGKTHGLSKERKFRGRNPETGVRISSGLILFLF